MRWIGSGLLMVATVLGTLSPSVKAEEREPSRESGAPNVRITFTVGRIESSGDVPLKSYSLLAAGNGDRAEMLTGARVPFPVTRASADRDEPVTTFSYQNVGFTAAVEALVLPGGKIKLAGNIEDSSLAEPSRTGGGPIIQTLDQKLSAILENGVPLRINSVDEAGTRSLYIEIKADTL